tara:strand:- start:1472 stop:1642 length:171 start_codon:yes stop_codon:yes gene_type:complete
MMFDVDTHLVLSIDVEGLLDVFLRGLLGREPVASGVGVAFEEASDSVDYCIVFHAD